MFVPTNSQINLALAVLVANFAADNAESKKKSDEGRPGKGVSTLRRIIWAILVRMHIGCGTLA